MPSLLGRPGRYAFFLRRAAPGPLRLPGLPSANTERAQTACAHPPPPTPPPCRWPTTSRPPMPTWWPTPPCWRGTCATCRRVRGGGASLPPEPAPFWALRCAELGHCCAVACSLDDPLPAPCALPPVFPLQDCEFTVQDGILFMLQTRNGKRTGPAALQVRPGAEGWGVGGDRAWAGRGGIWLRAFSMGPGLPACLAACHLCRLLSRHDPAPLCCVAAPRWPWPWRRRGWCPGRRPCSWWSPATWTSCCTPCSRVRRGGGALHSKLGWEARGLPASARSCAHSCWPQPGRMCVRTNRARSSTVPPRVRRAGVAKPEYKKAVLGKGLPASPGAAVGKVVFTADEAEKWDKEGEKVGAGGRGPGAGDGRERTTCGTAAVVQSPLGHEQQSPPSLPSPGAPTLTMSCPPTPPHPTPGRSSWCGWRRRPRTWAACTRRRAS